METRVPTDAERERTADGLHAAVGDGRLTLDEFDARLKVAYATPSPAELAVVTSDLPAATVPLATPCPETKHTREARLAWLRVSLLLITIWLVTSVAAGHPLFFWPAFPVGIWGATLAVSTGTGRPGCRP